MKGLLFIFLLIPGVFYAQSTYYIAPDGDDSGVGTIVDPWLTLQKAFDEVAAGDTVYLRGGTYNSYARATLSTSGTAANHIVIEGYPADISADNWPIFDCRAHCDSIVGATIYNYAIQLYRVEYVTLKCFEVKNVFQCDSVNTGAIAASDCANITYERLKIHDISTARGFYHTSGAWSYADSAYAVGYGTSPSAATPIFNQPDTTRWINCDVWNIADTLEVHPGNAADGWKVVSYWGNYYYWEGCRAWNYCDDGFDPNGGKRVFENCWAMSSNKYYDPGNGFDIERNGIKVSVLNNTAVYLSYYTDDDSAALVNDSLVNISNCLVIYCPGRGLYTGLESDTALNGRWYNNTVYSCGYGIAGANFSSYDTVGDYYANNIVYASTLETATEIPYDVALMNSSFNLKYGCDSNTWERREGYPQFGSNPSYTVSDADFVTVDSSTLVGLFTAPRQADGSLPANRPMMLASGSDLIDGGIVAYTGQTYNGTAPDLGYYESDSDVPVAAFSASSTSVNTGANILFTDASTNTPYLYEWSFPGGTPDTSNLQNPVIQYNTAGTYTVTLKATNAAGNDTEQKAGYITVSNPYAPASSYRLTIKFR